MMFLRMVLERGLGLMQVERSAILRFHSLLAGLLWSRKIGEKTHRRFGLGVVVMKTDGCIRTMPGLDLAPHHILLEEGVSRDGGDGSGESGMIRKKQRPILDWNTLGYKLVGNLSLLILQETRPL